MIDRPRPPSRPRTKAPPGAADCHFHIFGPRGQYPFARNRSYTPGEASIAEYLTVAETLGIQRMVVVQPSPYGTDNRCTLDAVEQFGVERARAVAVIDPSFTDDALAELDRRGVRGIRFNLVTEGGTPVEQLQTIASRIAGLGWHVQIYADGRTLAALKSTILALPVPVVLDHMGQIPLERGRDSEEALAVLELLRCGCWIKLCGYRISLEGPPYSDVLEFARALVATAPERCLWGSDWPHPFLEGRPMPDDGNLLDLLFDWAKEPDCVRRILVDNPARLYGF